MSVVDYKGLLASKTLLTRFMDKVSPEALSGCWLWTGALSPDGYGSIATGVPKSMGLPKGVKAHVACWHLFGRVAKGSMYVLHKCDVRCCVAPHHLFLGTQKDNVADMYAKGRAYDRKGKQHKIQTECKRGHLLVDPNIYHYKGARYCLTCVRMRASYHNPLRYKKQEN